MEEGENLIEAGHYCYLLIACYVVVLLEGVVVKELIQELIYKTIQELYGNAVGFI